MQAIPEHNLYPLPKRWRVFDQIGSTNDSIHAAAATGELEGTVHVAHEQIGGRGRLGRTWWSPPGSGLWMSVLLRPRIPAEKAAGLSLLAGLAVLTAGRIAGSLRADSARSAMGRSADTSSGAQTSLTVWLGRPSGSSSSSRPSVTVP